MLKTACVNGTYEHFLKFVRWGIFYNRAVDIPTLPSLNWSFMPLAITSPVSPRRSVLNVEVAPHLPDSRLVSGLAKVGTSHLTLSDKDEIACEPSSDGEEIVSEVPVHDGETLSTQRFGRALTVESGIKMDVMKASVKAVPAIPDVPAFEATGRPSPEQQNSAATPYQDQYEIMRAMPIKPNQNSGVAPSVVADALKLLEIVDDEYSKQGKPAGLRSLVNPEKPLPQYKCESSAGGAVLVLNKRAYTPDVCKRIGMRVRTMPGAQMLCRDLSLDGECTGLISDLNKLVFNKTKGNIPKCPGVDVLLARSALAFSTAFILVEAKFDNPFNKKTYEASFDLADKTRINVDTMMRDATAGRLNLEYENFSGIYEVKVTYDSGAKGAVVYAVFNKRLTPDQHGDAARQLLDDMYRKGPDAILQNGFYSLAMPVMDQVLMDSTFDAPSGKRVAVTTVWKQEPTGVTMAASASGTRFGGSPRHYNVNSSHAIFLLNEHGATIGFIIISDPMAKQMALKKEDNTTVFS